MKNAVYAVVAALLAVAQPCGADAIDGVIEICSRDAFGRDTPFVVTGESTDGKIVIPPGVSVRIASVTVNGRQINRVVDSGLVTGGGRLVAGASGFSIIFR